MKAKIKQGNNFKGVLEYALDKKKGPEIIAGNMFGTTPSELAREFESIAKLKKIKNPVYHKSLSQPPGAQNRLSDEVWDAIVKRDLEKSGFDTDKTQYVVIRHKDKEHDHVHIIINKVNCDGKVFNDSGDIYKAIETTQEIEREFNLTRTPGRERRAKKRPSRAECEAAWRKGQELTPREKLQDIIDKILDSGSEISARDYRDKLQAQGVAVHANLARTGRMNGFSYQIDGIYFKSSSLGKKYTYQSLKTRGLTFDQADRNAFSKNIETGELDHEPRHITEVPTIRENSVLDMHIFNSTEILDTKQGKTGSSAVLRQTEIESSMGRQKQIAGVQHIRAEIKTIETTAQAKYDPIALSPQSAARRADEKARRQAEAAPAPEVAQSITPAGQTPGRGETAAPLGEMDARRAKAALSHLVGMLQYKRPGHEELRQSLPDLLLQHAERVVSLKDYPVQQKAVKELFQSDDGLILANMILNNEIKQEISK